MYFSSRLYEHTHLTPAYSFTCLVSCDIILAEVESPMNAEKRVKEALKREFGQDFKRRVLQVGRVMDGSPAYKEFDAVSSDSKIVAMVKDYSAQNEIGNQTRHARVIRDLYYLCLAQADQRFMYLSREFLEWFRKQRDASVPSDVKIRIVPSVLIT